MTNYSIQTTPYANNATIRTGLARCDQSFNLTQTIQDLHDLYASNISNPVSDVFSNLSIINFNCTISSGKFFEHIITFTRSVSIRVQITFASVYYDYIYSNQYSFNGFYIDPEQGFNLSSTTLNNNAQSDACSSAYVAHDPLCPQNSSTPICTTLSSNPWIFNCSGNVTTSTVSSFSTTNNNQQWISTTASPIFSPWLIGLMGGLGTLFLLMILLSIGYFLRRHSRSKRITFSRENLLTDMKSMRKSGIPQVQAFQRVTTIIQPKQYNRTAITRVSYGNRTQINNKTVIHRKPPSGTYNQRIFIDHAKVHDPAFPPPIPPRPTKPIYIPHHHVNTITPKVYQTVILSRPVPGTSTSQLRSITNRLEDNNLGESDNISLDRLNSTKPRKPSASISRQSTNISSIDESLHDEDAWMSILDVANAELDVLNRLENEQNIRIK